jgi:hypothetical protein
MLSFSLLMWCLICGGLYLLVLSLILDFAEKRLRVTEGIPAEMVESSGPAFFVMNYIMEALFYVAIPSIAFSFFYTILPLSGTRSGLGAALFAFVLGAAPLAMRLSVRLKLPMPYVLFSLISHLLKLGGALVIIATLYAM